MAEWSRKGRPLPGAPRTEPYERLSRIRLPPRVFDGEAIAWPGVADFGFGEPVVGQLDHALPREVVPLAAAPERAQPRSDDPVAEARQCAAIGRHCMVVEEAGHDLLQPSP